MSVEVSSLSLPPKTHGRVVPWLGVLVLLLLGLGLWAQGLPGVVAWQLARDHSQGLGGRPGSRAWSSEPAVVSAWLEERGTPVPPLPRHAGSAGLVGARYCSLLDRVAAHVVYQGEESAVSIFVLHGPLRAPHGWSGTVHGLHVRLVRSAGRPLAIVGEREEDVRAALRAIATSIADTGTPLGSGGGRRFWLTLPHQADNFVSYPGGAVAQLGARVNGIHEVAGSIPASSTNPEESLEESARGA